MSKRYRVSPDSSHSSRGVAADIRLRQEPDADEEDEEEDDGREEDDDDDTGDGYSE